MKYIITESQSEYLNLMRRWGSEDHKELISDIVNEGLGHFEPCDYDDVETYISFVIENSANTFLYHWIDHRHEKFNGLQQILIDEIYQNYYFSIYHYYYDNLEDC